ncbi:hypothetical protein ABC977_16170 [Thioalkalicoccus limnaeus]|uniref:YtxH domain-containing protein n=1 Tax=Thioalkalicoccus limnaeus TaxID=120681 RepID=A0ABV4BHE4_9GAMM
MSMHYPPHVPPYPVDRQAQGQGPMGSYHQSQFQHPGMAPGAMGQPGFGPQAYQAPGYQAGYFPNSAYAPRTSAPFFNLSNDRFVKGVLIGAAATYLLTNENVQRSMIKGAVRIWSMLQGGVEEIKERFQDAEAELHHEAERRGSGSDI